MTYFPNPNCANQIKVEIGANRFFVGEGININYSRIPGQSQATFSLRLPASFLAPRRYTIAAVLGSNGIKKFGGLYTAESVEYLESNEKKYNCRIEDFTSYTRRFPIFSYKATGSLQNHLDALTIRAKANNPASLLNYIVCGVISSGDSDPESTFTPTVNPDMFEFEFVEGYLFDAFNQLAQLLGYSWDITANTWNSIANLTSGYIAIVRFRRNGLRGNPAPHPLIYAPSNNNVICPTDRFYQSLSLDVSFPECSSVLCLGFNGEERAADPSFPATIDDTRLRRLDPISSLADAVLEFPYPENAKKITGVRITTI